MRMDDKMNCIEFEELLSAFHDNTLDHEQQKEFDKHLKECEVCAGLTKGVDHIKAILPELNTEVPFFLKNRLYLISESEEKEKIPDINYAFMKWIAAGIGTVVLFLNIFYFTNIFPAANKTLHNAVAGIENFVVETEAFIGRIKESKNLYIFKREKIFSKTNEKKNSKAKIKIIKGIKYG